MASAIWQVHLLGRERLVHLREVARRPLRHVSLVPLRLRRHARGRMRGQLLLLLEATDEGLDGVARGHVDEGGLALLRRERGESALLEPAATEARGGRGAGRAMRG